MAKGLYIHIPFCVKKCKYCDFVSYSGKDEFFDIYTDALIKEAEQYRGEKLDTVFLGGGTPTVLPDRNIQKIADNIYKIFNIMPECEFSIEANPKTVDNNKLKTLKNIGVNRISVGVQSFCDEELLAIGRIHDAKSAYNTIDMIKNAGFDNFNIDLMTGLPNQTVESLEKTLLQALSLKPSHISCYSLILEENTPLYDEYKNGKYKSASDEYDRKLYHYAVDKLKEYGYDRYEISNFALPDRKCRHNLKYWNCDEYIGIGLAAHSYVGGLRYCNTSDFEKYIKGNDYRNQMQKSSENDKMCEYIIMRMRLCDGVDETEFFKRFNVGFAEKYKKQIEKFTSAGLIIHKGDHYFLSDRGIDVSNSILCEFV